MVYNRNRKKIQNYLLASIFIVGCLIMSFTSCHDNVNNGYSDKNVPYVVQDLPLDKKCTHYFEEKVSSGNKIETSDILALAAIIVSLFSLYFSIRQTNLQKGQFDSQKKENQPIFQVESRIARHNQDEGVDTDILVVSNIGTAPSSIDSIETKTFVEIRYLNYPSRKTIYIPIFGYYFYSTDRQQLTGEILINKTIGNVTDYCSLYYKCIDNSKNPIYYLCDLIKFVIIHYTDIYNEKHVVYFKNEKKCSKDDYDDIENKSKALFKEDSYDIKKLKFEDVLGFLELCN